MNPLSEVHFLVKPFEFSGLEIFGVCKECIFVCDLLH